jgi:hypothetical protein
LFGTPDGLASGGTLVGLGGLCIGQTYTVVVTVGKGSDGRLVVGVPFEFGSRGGDDVGDGRLLVGVSAKFWSRGGDDVGNGRLLVRVSVEFGSRGGDDVGDGRLLVGVPAKFWSGGGDDREIERSGKKTGLGVTVGTQGETELLILE